MLDVLVATINSSRLPTGLQYLPQHTVYHDTRAPWAAAANALLDVAAANGHDALFLDDDVELLPGSLDLVQTYYDAADLFGISLIAPNGPRGWYVQSAGHMLVKVAEKRLGLAPYDAFGTSVPVLAAHAGTSCMYIKHRALADTRVRFPEDWTGVHHEDIYFCLSAWLAGYKVARLPSTAIHYTHPIGAGNTKAQLPTFHSGRDQNMRALGAWMEANDLAGKCDAGIVPLGIRAMDGSAIDLRPPAHLKEGAL